MANVIYCGCSNLNRNELGDWCKYYHGWTNTNYSCGNAIPTQDWLQKMGMHNNIY